MSSTTMYEFNKMQEQRNRCTNKWIKHWVSGFQIKDYQYRCSNCGKSYWKWDIKDFHRCPNCNEYKEGVKE